MRARTFAWVSSFLLLSTASRRKEEKATADREPLEAKAQPVESKSLPHGPPRVIASDQQGVLGLTLSGDDVFWTLSGQATGNGKVVRAPRAGGAAKTLASGLAVPYGVAVLREYVYWAEERASLKGRSAVHRVRLGGGTVDEIGPPIPEAWSIALLPDEEIFVTALGNDSMSRISTNGTRSVIAPGPGKGVAIAVSFQRVFWTDADAGEVRGVHQGSDAYETLYRSKKPVGLATDGYDLYVSDFETKEIVRVSLDGSHPSRVVGAAANPIRDLAVDEHWVYGVDAKAGTVIAWPKKGGDPIVLADHRAGPYAIVADARGIVWTETNGGNVVALDR